MTRYVDEPSDWRRNVLARLRRLIRKAGPSLVEGWKWNTPVWSQNGNVVAVGAFRDHVKVNFFDGALLDDPRGLLNTGLDAKRTRAIDIRQGDRIDETAFSELVRGAAALDRSKPQSTSAAGRKKR